MKEYINNYIKEIDEIIEKNTIENKEELLKNHLIKIEFFQHERLVHLLVTLFFALFILLSVFLINSYPISILMTTILVIVLIFYIFHYYTLENGVQYLYKQYDKLKELSSKK